MPHPESSGVVGPSRPAEDARGKGSRSAPSICEPGRNCWRIARANRVGFLVDGADYFAAVARAIEHARSSITILGWDIYSKVRLLRDDHGEGSELRAVLANALQRNPQLHVHILMWDVSLLYDLRRDPWGMFRFRWPRRRRLHFHWDSSHPGSGCHHQKIVVIDGRLAFCGGIDLTDHRWDTTAHRLDDPRRVTAEGKPYGPFHDVQMAVDGEAATALLEIANERWRRATGRALPGVDLRAWREPAPEVHAAGAPGDDAPSLDAWPRELQVHLCDVDVAIARTDPGVDGELDVREVERLFLDAIAAARECIYIENQYFTSRTIGEALASRLAEDDGPEIVLVGPRDTSGWLQELTMGTLRERLLAHLRRADRHGRLLACCPELGPEKACGVFVHAKVMIVDDVFLRIGSANTNNRSLGVDTECDLALEASGDEARAAVIRRFRNQLVAEHTGLDVTEVEARLQRDPGLLRMIREARSGPRRLRELHIEEDALEAMVPDESIVDPEAPVQLDRMVDHFLPPAERGKASRPSLLWSAVAFVLLLVALPWLWRVTPLHEWLAPERLEEWLRPLRSTWLSFLLVVAAFVAASLLLIPISLLVLQAGIVFGPWLGSTCAMCGVAAGAAVTFGIGRMLGARTVERLAGGRLRRLGHRIAAHGILAMMVLRNLPIAPFGLVNVMVGTSPMRFRDFMIGTLLGILPGAFGFALFGDQLARTVARPGAGSYALLILIAAAILGCSLAFRRLFRKRAGALAAAT